MLHQVLQAFERASGPLSLDELSRGLGIDRGALDGMIDFWVRKGRLKVSGAGTCSPTGCGGCAAHAGGCVFDASGPRTITLATSGGEKRL
ncbi:MAG: hypothetical protein HC822_12110 [Oscillochloris sp.]|nr:hypothetical protein [Oscillochloris sp.]